MSSPAGSPPRPFLLLVDDDHQIRMLLREIGHRAGFEVAEAVNGREAMDALRRRHVDLMLLDLHMPEASGFEVLRASRSTRLNSASAALNAFRAVCAAICSLRTSR